MGTAARYRAPSPSSLRYHTKQGPPVAELKDSGTVTAMHASTAITSCLLRRARRMMIPLALVHHDDAIRAAVKVKVPRP